MEKIYSDIRVNTISSLHTLYGIEVQDRMVQVGPTKKEFEGHLTVVTFPFVKLAKSAPEQVGEALGQKLVDTVPEVVGYNVVKGFLNLSLSKTYFKDVLESISSSTDYGIHPSTGKKVIIEFSSPNTNKPLHLGHLRNILLGWTTSLIMEAAGHKVIKGKVVNDRGIAICKSMLAHNLFGEGKTPSSEGKKGDHFVGEYYVVFNQKFEAEYDAWQSSGKGKEVYQNLGGKDDEKSFFAGYKNKYFNEYSDLGRQAKEMLQKWEQGDNEVKAKWSEMNTWVYEGFNETYNKLGVNFDFIDYESNTYLAGKDIVEQGLTDKVFYKKKDGSVWIDLEKDKLDHKLVLRSDGTSVYLTQDFGTADKRSDTYGFDKMIYVVGNEQDYHFKVLFKVLEKLNRPYAEGLYHLSYGMVDLPSGKMKSREGTVVDADDIIREVISEAQASAEERGELTGMSEEQKNDLYYKIGMAALNFFLLKVQPQKRMLFDPKESVDMQGQTGPYIQNAFVRIRSILRKNEGELDANHEDYKPNDHEVELIMQLASYPALVRESANKYDPSILANYLYLLAKSFHKYYHDYRILGAETQIAKSFRLQLVNQVSQVIEACGKLLGISMPEKM